ncbi:Protein SQS1 [Neolecta irregularis DAH-3]|uniref:Protein SQS1 n=1 Tax=Neolecta irregularis (strain DAH-3) TaxID=1198029 RepID=A0A1U7LPU6_NEOID|nr:Protein SQS1 [Neolecta irregularis DAH-3]|eukprot:OLL24677.1 Protein SQS1 [Neolecta irregularis DAH-3]
MHISTQGSPLRRRTVAFVCPSARPPLSACSDEEILFVPRLSRSKHPPDVDDVSPDDVSGGCTSVPRYKSVPSRYNSPLDDYISMDRASRKIIHLLALAYNLKSKSSGSGARRRPSLIRTPRTTYSPNEQMIASILKRKHSHNPSPHKIKPWIRDGEIVGNGAPEIAQNNKGRRMLENLGWKSGMVLGTCNAQSGNLHPIQAIFKNNKFGLG